MEGLSKMVLLRGLSPLNGRREGDRTLDLFRVKEALSH